MIDASAVFLRTVEWLQEHYAEYRFFTERDVVWTVQTRLRAEIEEMHLPLRVFNDYPILPGPRRSLSADLALLDDAGRIHVAVEFKYEPSHRRTDIWPTKFGPTVVFWGMDGVAKDVARIQQFVAEDRTRVAYALFIDEAGYFRHRQAHPGSRWIDWQVNGMEGAAVSVLWAEAIQ